MNISGFVVIICWLLLQGEFSLARGNTVIDLEEFACIVEQCMEYCSFTATPCHDHHSELKVATDANNEMKDKIHTLEVTINSLRSQINDSEDQIKDLRKQIKDEQVTDFREQVKVMYGVLAGKNDEISKINKTKAIEIKGRDDQIKELRTQIKDKDKNITELREQVKKMSGVNITKAIEIKGRDDQIKELRTQIKDKDKNITELREQVKKMSGALAGKNDEISKINKTKAIEIKDRDDQIKELRTQIKDKDKNITELRVQVKKMSGVLAEKNDQLSKMNETAKTLSDRCPNGGPYGIFLMKVNGLELFPVRCDSGWMVIQRRIDGSVDFNRNWSDYKMGFGDMWGEFFIGLDKLHLITAAHPQELYIQLQDVIGTKRYAKYDNFSVGSEEDGFNLKSLGKYSGNAGDYLRKHETGKFATLDRDSSSLCASQFDGPWWFDDINCCGKSSLNGRYTKNGIAPNQNGISWGHWQKDYTISLTFVKIQIRPRSPQP